MGKGVRHWCLYLFTFCLLLCSCCASGETVVLINQQNTDYKIVIPDNATPAEKNAADILAMHLNHFLTAGSFKIIKNATASSADGHYIFIGKSLTHKRLPATESYKADEIRYQLYNGQLYFSAENERALIYSVFDFLESEVNIRFWTPFETDYPELKNLTLSDINYKYAPPVSYRSHFTYNANYSEAFAAALKLNGDYQKTNNHWGETNKILGWVHTFETILPVQKYFKQHPEWYAPEANNFLPASAGFTVADPQRVQLCLSDSQMRKEFRKNLNIWVKANPGYKYISVSQNDVDGYCHCANCLRKIEELGSPTDLLFDFLNEVIGDVVKQYPEKRIITLAYYFSENPPVKVMPHQNIIIQFAPINANFAYPFISDKNQKVKTSLQAWKNFRNEKFLWTYNTNFSNNLLPYPSLGTLREDITSLPFKGVFVQDNTNPEGYGYFLDMQSWVVPKLLWNPGQKTEDLVNYFFENYYGAAGKYLLAYYKLVESRFMQSGTALQAFNTSYSFLDSRDVSEMESLMTNALKSAQNEKFKKRILKEKLSFDFLKVYVQGNPADTYSFFENLKNTQYESPGVGYALKQYQSRLFDEILAADRNRAKPALQNNKLVIQQNNFSLYRLGDLTGIELDAGASDKKAAYIIPKTADWAVQVPLNGYDLPFGKKANVTANIKFISSNPGNSTVTVGIFDNDRKVEVTHKEVILKKNPAGIYFKVQMENLILPKNATVWFNVNNVNSTIEKLYVDNIEVLNKL